MTKSDRMKRRLLREAVEDNVATIRGLAPGPLRRNRRLAAIWMRRSMLLLVPIALLGSSYLASSGLEARDPMRLERAGVMSLPRLASPASDRTFDAPQPIDPAVLSLGVRRIVIDAGHGGANPGTIGNGGLMEKDLTVDIGRRLAEKLKKGSFDVVMTRSADETITLSDRALLANRSSGDLFVSIHLNALRNPSRRGVETYYLGPTNDPFLKEIAAAENRDSGYSLSDMRRLLDGIYAGVRQDESRALAEAVQIELFRSLRQINPMLQDRGVKTAPFVVLVATDMPAILAEVSCLSNQEEIRLLHTPEYRERIAQALFAGIESYAGRRAHSSQKGS